VNSGEEETKGRRSEVKEEGEGVRGRRMRDEGKGEQACKQGVGESRERVKQGGEGRGDRREWGGE